MKDSDNLAKLQSRRQFLKKALQKTLPFIGGVILLTSANNEPSIARPIETGCKDNCKAICVSTCLTTCKKLSKWM